MTYITYLYAEQITNTADRLDSRDIIDRIEFLKGAHDTYRRDGNADVFARDGYDAELSVLVDLAYQGENYLDDWEHGVQLIRESDFVNYAQELAEDLGALQDINGHGWPACHIDWNAAADALRADYEEVEFDGPDGPVTYLAR